MNENAKRWVEALRSGEYEQTTGRLHDDHGYCCLGVACDVYRKETGKGEWTLGPADDCYTFRVNDLDRDAILLPAAVTEYFGIMRGTGRWGNGHDESLTVKNDHGASFEEIANIIEEGHVFGERTEVFA